MNGAQDLGGMMGFGPIEIEADEPLFHHAWEKRAMAVTLAAGACGMWTIDRSRFTRESLPPAQYLTKSYYDIWITALERLLAQTGMADETEISAGRAMSPPLTTPNKLMAADVAAALAKGTSCSRPLSRPARFAPGDAVRTKVMHPTTHTRLPRYARGKLGVIESVRGAFVFPDANAHGGGEHPQWVYTVRFSAAELWGDGADANSTVSIDAFEPYLERA